MLDAVWPRPVGICIEDAQEGIGGGNSSGTSGRMQMSFLLDCRGEATHLRGPAHHSVGPRPSGHSQHVVHSGCVVYHCAPNAITIRFRPSLISPSALARIESWLDAKARHRMHLVYWLHDEWHHELLHTPKMAFKRIEALVSFAGGGRYGHVVRSIESPAHIEHGAFSDVISLWRERRESFEPEKLFPLLHARMQGRATLFDASTSPELRLVQPGEALTAGTHK